MENLNNSSNTNRVKLVALISTLEVDCVTQISCTRSRANLLKIKKLSDALRKDYLLVCKKLKEERKLKPKAVKVPKLVKEVADDSEVVVKIKKPRVKKVKVEQTQTETEIPKLEVVADTPVE